MHLPPVSVMTTNENDSSAANVVRQVGEEKMELEAAPGEPALESFTATCYVVSTLSML